MPNIPEIDLAPLSSGAVDQSANDAASTALVDACRRWGFVRLRNHGVSSTLLDEAFTMQAKMFGLPPESKMKAPHPPGFMPHRGYTSPGVEQSYSWDELDEARTRKHGDGLPRQVQDFRESYDIGSDHNCEQQNVWLPNDMIPGFRAFETKLYWELEALSRRILHAFVRGLQLPDADIKYIDDVHSGHNNQLRLLHYPQMDVGNVDQSKTTRMSAHVDWSSFTLLLQDQVGGLELQDPSAPGNFIRAIPEADTIILNVGDMLMRMTNGDFHSPSHRVAAPPVVDGQMQSRYSIPYFVLPDDEAVIKILGKFSKESTGAESKYEPIKFVDYTRSITEFLHSGKASEK